MRYFLPRSRLRRLRSDLHSHPPARALRLGTNRIHWRSFSRVSGSLCRCDRVRGVHGSRSWSHRMGAHGSHHDSRHFSPAQRGRLRAKLRVSCTCPRRCCSGRRGPAAGEWRPTGGTRGARAGGRGASRCGTRAGGSQHAGGRCGGHGGHSLGACLGRYWPRHDNSRRQLGLVLRVKLRRANNGPRIPRRETALRWLMSPSRLAKILQLPTACRSHGTHCSDSRTLGSRKPRPSLSTFLLLPHRLQQSGWRASHLQPGISAQGQPAHLGLGITQC
mmetsp:Transcript_39055/g.85202  ORF Transcript_39055/g.85202 Transcript_39055/m.85202 type:complete len:275 (-) Transcript_39055:1508-2332(-)